MNKIEINNLKNIVSEFVEENSDKYDIDVHDISLPPSIFDCISKDISSKTIILVNDKNSEHVLFKITYENLFPNSKFEKYIVEILFADKHQYSILKDISFDLFKIVFNYIKENILLL